MRRFKVTFIKTQTLVTPKNGPVQMAEQDVLSDNPKFNIQIPQGYAILQIIEILEPVTIQSNGNNND